MARNSSDAWVQLNRMCHILVETPFLRHVRRLYRGAKELLEFVNLENGRHALAMWVNKPRGLVIEVANYEEGRSNVDHLHQVLFNLNNDRRVRGLLRIFRDQVSAEYSRRDAWAAAEQERRDHREFHRRRIPNLDKRKDPRWLQVF